MSDHLEIPVRMKAWLRVEDGNVTGIDLMLDDLTLDDDLLGFRSSADGEVYHELSREEMRAALDALPSRHEWDVRRVENSDGGVYFDS